MAIKVNFTGVPCYDFIQYIARVLYRNGNSVLLIDFSCANDRSLEASIPCPDGLMEGHTIDYCGIRYSKNYFKKYDNEYNYILFYSGFRSTLHVQSQWQFIVCDSQEQNITNMIEELGKFELYHINMDKVEEQNIDNNKPIIIYLDFVVNKKEYIKFVLENQVNKENIMCCELSYTDYEQRLLCQTENVVKFSRITSDYKELVKECSIALLQCGESKDFMVNYKLAERGR